MNLITRLKKAVSLTVTSCLLLSLIISPSSINAMTNEEATKQYKQIFKNFILPYGYGQITKSHYAATDRVIINIQDLHCHPQVQKNIANIIETFDKSYGVNKIYLEGAYGKVSTGWINKKTDKESRAEILEKMLKTGRLTGAEYYSAISGKAEIIEGLEEKEPYLDNLKRLADIIKEREKAEIILKALEDSTRELKKKHYTQRQKKLEKLSKSYKDGKIAPQKYYGLLLKHIEKLGIDISGYENTFAYIILLQKQKELVYPSIVKELQSFILILKEKLPYDVYKTLLSNTNNFKSSDKLYDYITQMTKFSDFDLSANFKNLDKYFKYIELSKKINPIELVKEEQKLSQEINTRFSQTQSQREIVFLTYFEKYLTDYVKIEIAPQDYEYYRKNIDEYKRLWNKYVDNGLLGMLEPYIARSDMFYKINTDRNFYFAKNIFDKQNRLNKIDTDVKSSDDTGKIIENMKETKILDIVITGGFHSQTVTELLEKENVSYMVITPNVAGDVKTAEQMYYEITKEQSKINFQTFAPAVASLSPQLQNELLKLVSSGSRDFKEDENISEEEKAELISELAAAKILESDDYNNTGSLKEKLADIIKDVIEENYKDEVTPELLKKINVDTLPSLIRSKEKLEQVLGALQKNGFEQAVISVSEIMKIVTDKIYELQKQLETSAKTITDTSDKKSVNLTSEKLQKKLQNMMFSQKQQIINEKETYKIVLSIPFGFIRNMFIKSHREQNEQTVSVSLSLMLSNALKIAKNMSVSSSLTNIIDEISVITANFTKSSIFTLPHLVKIVLNPSLREKFIDVLYEAHTHWNAKEKIKEILSFDLTTGIQNKETVDFLEDIDNSEILLKLIKKYESLKQTVTEEEKRNVIFLQLSKYVRHKKVKDAVMSVLEDALDNFPAEDKKEILSYIDDTYNTNILSGLIAETENFKGENKARFLANLLNGKIPHLRRTFYDFDETALMKIVPDKEYSLNDLVTGTYKGFVTDIYDGGIYYKNFIVQTSDGNFYNFKAGIYTHDGKQYNYVQCLNDTLNPGEQLAADMRGNEETFAKIKAHNLQTAQLLNKLGIAVYANVSDNKNKKKWSLLNEEGYDGYYAQELLITRTENCHDGTKIYFRSSSENFFSSGLKERNLLQRDEPVFRSLQAKLGIKYDESDKSDRYVLYAEDLYGFDLLERKNYLINIIKKAINEKKCFVFYPSRVDFDDKKLTVTDFMSNFKYIIGFLETIALVYADLLGKKSGIRHNDIKFFVTETLKNAFGHGNKFRADFPMFLYFVNGGLYTANTGNDIEKDAKRQFAYVSVNGSGYHLGRNELKQRSRIYGENYGYYEMPQDDTFFIEYWGQNPDILKIVSPANETVQSVKPEEQTKSLNISYDKDKDRIIVLLLKKSDGRNVSIRVAPYRNLAYVSSVGGDAYSTVSSPYASVKTIEDFLGIKIDVKPSKITVKNVQDSDEISFVKNKDIEKIVSSLKQFDFDRPQERELQELQRETKTSETVFVYLDDDEKSNREKIKDAVQNRKLIALYPFSKTYDIDFLTDEELFSLYFDISNKFFEMADTLLPKLPEFKSKEFPFLSTEYFLKEFVKNAFVHGNSSDTSKPIYIACYENAVSVYNGINYERTETDIKKRRFDMSAAATLTGQHKGLQTAQKLEGIMSLRTQTVLVANKEYYVATAQKEEPKAAIKDVDNDIVKEDKKAKQEESFVTDTQIITELPETFARLSDDYNQFENMSGLPTFDHFDSDKREAYQEFFEDDVFAVSEIEQKVTFEKNTKYVYILQNQENKNVLLDVLKKDTDIKFKLFALMYISRIYGSFSEQEKIFIDAQKLKIREQFKSSVANNDFKLLNNFDLRAYMMGIYMLLVDFTERKTVPYIIYRAVIINPDGKTLANSSGFFAEVDFFTIVHELTHVMLPKPKFFSWLVTDTIDELVSYITPNLIMKIINLSLKYYKDTDFKYYTFHYDNETLDYVRMGKIFHGLYNLFSDKTDDKDLQQDDHKSAIAFFDLLYYAHKSIGKQISSETLIKTVAEKNWPQDINQQEMFYILFDKYCKNVQKYGIFTESEINDLRKETEKMQLWTLISYDIVHSIEQDRPELYKKIIGTRTPEKFDYMLLRTPDKTKDFFEKNDVAAILKSKGFLTQKDIINLLLIEVVIKNIDYENLAYDFDKILPAIIEVTRNALTETVNENKETFSVQEYEEIKKYVSHGYGYIINTEKEDKTYPIIIDNITDFISSSIDSFFFIEKLINKIFAAADGLSLNITDKKLIITETEQQAQNFKSLFKSNNVTDIVAVSMDIMTSPQNSLRGGFVLDAENAIRVKYDKQNSKIIVYSKRGISLSSQEIKEMFISAYHNTRSETLFNMSVAFAERSDFTLQEIENRLKNEYTNSVVMPSKETKFDISKRNVSDIDTVCRQESSATGTKTFIVSAEQARTFAPQTETLRTDGYKFVVDYKSYEDFSGIFYDGLKMDLTDVIDVERAKQILETIKKQALQKGIGLSLSVKFNDKVYEEFTKQNINVFETYSVLPITSSDSKFAFSRNMGKTEFENITETDIERVLRNDNVVSMVFDDATVICNRKNAVKQAKTREEKYNKGYNAASVSKFDYTSSNVNALSAILYADITDDTALEKLWLQTDMENLSLSSDSKSYVEYLLAKNRYEEATGFIRGVASNTVKKVIVSKLDQNNLIIDVDKLRKDSGGMFEKAFLTLAVQLALEGKSIESLLDNDFSVSDEIGAEEFFNVLTVTINEKAEEILKRNEYKITRLSDTVKAVSDFNEFNVLLQDKFAKVSITAEMKISLNAVKSILTAA